MDYKNFNDLDCETLDESKSYSKAYDAYIKLEEENIVKKAKDRYPGFFKLLGKFIVISIIIFILEAIFMDTRALNREWWVPIFLYSMYVVFRMIINPFMRKGLIKEEIEVLKNKMDFKNKGFVRFCIETKMNITSKVLGQAFFIKENEITGTKKREYYGYISVVLPEKGSNQYSLLIHFYKTNMLCKQNFLISDIIGFTTLSPEGLGDVRGHSKIDTSGLDTEMTLASHARRNAEISKITGRGSFLNDINANKAMIAERDERVELQNKIQNEEERVQDETFIKLLEFKNGNHFLISHLDGSTVTALGNAIENAS